MLFKLAFKSLFLTCYHIIVFEVNVMKMCAQIIKKETGEIYFVDECRDGHVSWSVCLWATRSPRSDVWKISPRRLSLYQDVYSISLIQLFFPDFSQDLPNGNAAGHFLLCRGLVCPGSAFGHRPASASQGHFGLVSLFSAYRHWIVQTFLCPRRFKDFGNRCL